MSKERELLKQIQQFLQCDCVDIYGFAGDIEELLTQPEQEVELVAVSKLRELRDIQGKKGNYDYDEYMRGLYNGLELALSLFEDGREPQYKDILTQPEFEQDPFGYIDSVTLNSLIKSENHQSAVFIYKKSDGADIALYTSPSKPMQEPSVAIELIEILKQSGVGIGF